MWRTGTIEVHLLLRSHASFIEFVAIVTRHLGALLWVCSQELITRKEELIAARASPPVYLKADLRELELSPSTFGTRFDVILIDPPWEEYVRRAPGVADTTGFWHPHEIANLKIEAIADTPSFVFLWVGNAEGLEWGRTCLKKVAPEVGWVTSKAH